MFFFATKNIKYIKSIALSALSSLSGAISNSQWAVIFSWQFEQRYSSFSISSNVLEIPSLTNAPFENFKCLELIKGVTWQQSYVLFVKKKLDIRHICSRQMMVQKAANYKEIRGKGGKYLICPRIYHLV